MSRHTSSHAWAPVKYAVLSHAERHNDFLTSRAFTVYFIHHVRSTPNSGVDRGPHGARRTDIRRWG